MARGLSKFSHPVLDDDVVAVEEKRVDEPSNREDTSNDLHSKQKKKKK